jgi:CHAD domain-containing protein
MDEGGVPRRTARELAHDALTQSTDAVARAARAVAAHGDDPVEDVHDLRVAIRRVRADLRVFAPVFDPPWLEVSNSRLEAVAQLAGRARDLDVIIDRLASIAPSLPAPEAFAVEALLQGLRSDRHDEMERIVAELAPTEPSAVDQLARSLTSGPLSAHAALVEIDDLVEAATRQWRKLRASARRAADAPTEDALHRVRIRTKNLRYSLDTLAPVLHPSARNHAKALAALQDHLGHIQDGTVVERWLRARGTRVADPFVAGELVGIERARREQLVDTWRAEWRRATRPRLRRWTR